MTKIAARPIIDDDVMSPLATHDGTLRSLLWTLALPTCMAVGLLVAAIGFYTPKAVVSAAIDDAVQRGEQTAAQLRTLRSFYSDQVVSRARNAGMTASPTYRSETQTIPVPTTFILDAATAFSTDDTKVELVSPYPWPTRAGRKLDAFQQEAWARLSHDPSGRFVRREQIDGRDILRVAVGDRMDQSCVTCHNTHPLSPRKDWKVGDVRGIIEVDRPIDAVEAGAQHLSWQLVGSIVGVGVLLLALLILIGLRLIRPLRDLTTAIQRMSAGERQDRLPHTGRRDELGTVARALVSLQEQTAERARAEAQITFMAQHDVLTGLPNRLMFSQELHLALGRAKHGEQFAVLCIDLDHFKAVNDTLGHPAGDALLREAAARLQSCLGDGDHVARLGGDEFAILHLGAEMPVGATHLAESIVALLSAPFVVAGHQIVVGASVGIALAPGDGVDADGLLKGADMALYRAKEDGRGTHRFFEPAMDALMQARRALELDLRSAIANREFEVYYQPLVSLSTDEVCGFEALLRWRHPTRGLVSPAEFIPLAEEIGVISAIGAWVLEKACSEAATWPPEIKVAVNVSAAQFTNSTLVRDVISALAASGLPADRLELEITETAMIRSANATIAILSQIKDLGVRIAMDDFGTGYSSLSYLRTFPFDKIKIDRAFTGDISESKNSTAIVRAVIGLGTSFNMSTTAEGVETQEQLERLRAEGCAEVQGFLFSQPRPAREISAMMENVRGRLTEAA